MAEEQVPSLDDPRAIGVLRGLGGYTQLVKDCAAAVLAPLHENPRARRKLEHIERQLRSKVPALRAKVQSTLVRITLPTRAATQRRDRREPTAKRTPRGRRQPLAPGAHAEVELVADELGWKGWVDLLTVHDDAVELVDFKTGQRKEAHDFQLRVYAVLWSHDAARNPSKRPVTNLTLTYDGGTVAVPAPDAAELEALRSDLTRRRQRAHAQLSERPPRATPNPNACRFCDVRHLCSDYWAADGRHVLRSGDFGDVELEVVGRHGPASWDARVVSARDVAERKAALLRTDESTVYSAGERLRVLDAALSPDPEDENGPLAVRLVRSSEVFVVPRQHGERR
jgi:CRISPR/Cas system-associated exonuclease Cas4 (RecB family)